MAALDAAERVSVEYAPLAPVADIERARQPIAAPVDPEHQSNLISHQTFATGDLQTRHSPAHRVSSRPASHSVGDAPLEPRGCVADWDAGRRHLTFRCGTQAPHPLRTALAGRLRLKEIQVTVVSPDVGGGFGLKIALLREELTVAALAIALARPVRWQEERGENLIAALHAREETILTRTAVTDEGRILALELEDRGRLRGVLLLSCELHGARHYDDSAGSLSDSGLRLRRLGVPHYEVSGRPHACTNGRNYIVDHGGHDRCHRARAIDRSGCGATAQFHCEGRPAIPDHHGRDLRRCNPRDAEAAIAAVDYETARARQARAREARVLSELGLCTVMKSTTYGSEFYKKAGIPGSGHEVAVIRMEPTGAVLVS